jgi:plasmid stabilization system protein ParE
MSQFVLHPEAYSDLNEIWEYIAADSLDAADRVVRESISRSIRSCAFRTKLTLALISRREACDSKLSAIM